MKKHKKSAPIKDSRGNYGDGNEGNLNTGHYNFGSGNYGSYNVGNDNDGDRNNGNGNIGNFNVGGYNVGDYNVGDFNITRYAFGCFNSIQLGVLSDTNEEGERLITLFNRPSCWSLRSWRSSKAYQLLCKIIPLPLERRESLEDVWHLKIVTQEERGQKATKNWLALSEDEREIIKAIPNFDAAIFKEITGIDVDA